MNERLDFRHPIAPETGSYGPKFYFLHRDNIKAQIAAIQAQRGVACPSHVTQWQLRNVSERTQNVLLPYKGRRLDFRRE